MHSDEHKKANPENYSIHIDKDYPNRYIEKYLKKKKYIANGRTNHEWTIQTQVTLNKRQNKDKQQK